MKAKKKIILPLVAIVVCLAFSVINVSAISKHCYTNTSVKSICADKTINPTRRIKSL